MKGFFAALFFAVLSPAWVKAQDPFAVLAYVNQNPITAYDVESRIELLKATGDMSANIEINDLLRAEILGDLIDEAIQIDQAAQQNILPPPEAVDENLAQIAARNNLTIAEFEDVLRARNINLQAFKTLQLTQMAWANVIRANANGRLNISDEDVEARWTEIRSQAGRTEWLLTEIYLEGASQETAEATAAALRSASDLAAFVSEVSDSPSAANNGDLGWVKEGTLGAKKEAALADLEPGDISAPIFSGAGYFIYRVQNIRPVGASSVRTEVNLKSIRIALDEGGQSLRDLQTLGALEAVLRQVSTCERFQQAADIYGEEGSGDLGFVNITALPPTHGNAIAQLSIDQISPLLPIEEGGIVYMLCGRREVAQPLTDDEVRNQIVNERSQALSEELMIRYRRQAYIEYL